MKKSCYKCVHYDVCKFVAAGYRLRFYKNNIVEELQEECTHFIEQQEKLTLEEEKKP